MYSPFGPGGRHKPINLSRGAFSALAAALGVALLGNAARADWTIQDADFRDHALVTINTWKIDEGLSFTDQAGKLQTLPTRNLVALSSGRQVTREKGSLGWKLTLRNGDVLFGEPTGMSGKSLNFKVPELGVLAIPLKRVGVLAAPVYGTAAAGGRVVRFGAADHDLIAFKSGDRLEGLIAGISAGRVQFLTENAQEPTDLELARIDYMTFGGVLAPRSVPPLSVRLTTVTGSVFTVPLDQSDQPFSWIMNTISLKDPAGRERSVDADMIAAIEILGARVVYLTELDPMAQEQQSFLGTYWPAQFNLNVLGQPLRTAGRTYVHGIGVHTQSTLVYELDGTFDIFALRVGLDDSAAPHGEAHVRIVLDGKTIWERRSLKPGEVSPELTLPVKGGKRLELHAEPASRLDVQGRVNWLNTALRRN